MEPPRLLHPGKMSVALVERICDVRDVVVEHAGKNPREFPVIAGYVERAPTSAIRWMAGLEVLMTDNQDVDDELRSICRNDGAARDALRKWRDLINNYCSTPKGEKALERIMLRSI